MNTIHTRFPSSVHLEPTNDNQTCAKFNIMISDSNYVIYNQISIGNFKSVELFNVVPHNVNNIVIRELILSESVESINLCGSGTIKSIKVKRFIYPRRDLRISRARGVGCTIESYAGDARDVEIHTVAPYYSDNVNVSPQNFYTPDTSNIEIYDKQLVIIDLANIPSDAIVQFKNIDTLITINSKSDTSNVCSMLIDNVKVWFHFINILHYTELKYRNIGISNTGLESNIIIPHANCVNNFNTDHDEDCTIIMNFTFDYEWQEDWDDEVPKGTVVESELNKLKNSTLMSIVNGDIESNREYEHLDPDHSSVYDGIIETLSMLKQLLTEYNAKPNDTLKNKIITEYLSNSSFGYLDYVKSTDHWF